MKKTLFLLCAFTLCSNALMANLRPVVISNQGTVPDHNEYYPPADMPEVYFESDDQEIILVADGFADYYDVDIISLSTMIAVISTQVDGYGDSIDVSSLPDDNYKIVIVSSCNNMYQGYFTNY